MTAHWEFTLGQERLIELLDDVQRAGVRFVAHNVRTADFEDPVFAAFALEEVNGVPVAVIGQAFPYVPVAHPKRFTPDWTFGLREDALQSVVDAARVQGAQVVVVLSHNGTDTDLKLASRLRGVDAILGGHTHDALPGALPVRTVDGGTTLVTNSGSNGKFVGVLDLDVHDGRVRDARWRLLPVFSNLIPADPEMAATIERLRAPYAAKLAEPLGIADRLLWRRGNFAGPWDHLILAALRDTLDCPVALSPGFRWGTTLLPGEPITREALYAQTAITYPETTITEMSGAQLHAVLEDVADNLFNPDPYQQQGGDMVRSAGLAYRVDPDAPRGQRIVDLRSADGTPLDPARRLRVAGWASVGEQPAAGAPIWDVVERWLAAR
jgi:sulfur-oxidizing protein SoxB